MLSTEQHRGVAVQAARPVVFRWSTTCCDRGLYQQQRRRSSWTILIPTFVLAGYRNRVDSVRCASTLSRALYVNVYCVSLYAMPIIYVLFQHKVHFTQSHH